MQTPCAPSAARTAAVVSPRRMPPSERPGTKTPVRGSAAAAALAQTSASSADGESLHRHRAPGLSNRGAVRQGAMLSHGVLILLVRRAKRIEVLGKVFEIPGEPEEVERGVMLIVVDEHPEVSLRRGERHGVPVDQDPAALARSHDVGGVRLPVGHDLARLRAPLPPRRAGRRARAARPARRRSPDCLPRRLGERPACPRLVHIVQRVLEMPPPGDREPGARTAGGTGAW